MIKKFHPFHIVEMSPWPLFASLNTLYIMMTITLWIHFSVKYLQFYSLLMNLFIAYLWWYNVSTESFNQGLHNLQVIRSLKIGMILFITSEVMFFLSFFWAFFHRRVSPNVELGQIWPPQSISPFNPLNIPLLNTLILVSSGISITWSHHLILNRNFKMSKLSLIITFILGIYFTLLQGFEYMEASFTMADSSYGRTFFVATGFHGLHVLIGSTFLVITYIRLANLSFSSSHLIGFELAAWYWHFVDVVWLFLYISMYWWG